MRKFRLPKRISSLFIVVFALVQAGFAGTVHTYYVASDEVEWNYTPLGIDRMMGMPFTGHARLFTEAGPHRIGSIYRKAIYREYTDDTFTQLKAPAPEWEHRGMLGPVLRAEVGDTIRVVFKNNATHPFTMHPHGVFYAKDSEGAGYDDGTSSPDKNGVPPGKTHIYNWDVPERAGPGPDCRREHQQVPAAQHRHLYKRSQRREQAGSLSQR